MTTKMLTNTAIKALIPGETVWDSEVRGLHVRAIGKARSFYLFFRTQNGVSRRPKIGDATVLSIGQAREIGRDMLAQVAAGGDPVAARTKAKGEPTVSEFFERCWREHWSRKKDSKNVRRIFDNRVAPRIGNNRVRDVDYADIARVHSALAATPTEANRTLALLSKLLNLAERYGERGLGQNPCRHVSRYPELSRRRFASGAELAKVGYALDAHRATSPAAALFIAILVFTGMRPGEVAAARREWITRFDNGAILRLPDSKTGQRDVHLSSHALAAIDALAAPKDGTLTGIDYPRRLWNHVRKAAGCPDLWLYDLRRTFATVSLASGAPLSLIGEVLGHKTAQTTKVYARLMSEAASGLVASTGVRMAGMLSAARPESASETAGPT